MIPVGWIESPVAQNLVGVPVYTVKPFPYQAGAFYATGQAEHPDPFVMIRPGLLREIERVAGSRRYRPHTYKVAAAYSALANEYAHRLGQDATDVGGFDGGPGHWPTISRLMDDLLKKSGVRNAAYRKWVIRRAKKTVGPISDAAHPLPGYPIPPPAPRN